MTERPILFSAPMVRALLDGTKSQTRRVLKRATGLSLSVGIDDDAPGVAELSWLYGDGPGHDVHEAIKRVPCPYGAPGDQLWVRETWGIALCGRRVSLKPEAWPEGLPVDRLRYAADGQEMGLAVKRPSIHMPRWASRISLEVTGVRVERLQDITRGDAMAEGCPFPNMAAGDDPRQWFSDLWQQINGVESWAANPWVWVVEFKVVKPCP